MTTTPGVETDRKHDKWAVWNFSSTVSATVDTKLRLGKVASTCMQCCVALCVAIGYAPHLACTVLANNLLTETTQALHDVTRREPAEHVVPCSMLIKTRAWCDSPDEARHCLEGLPPAIQLDEQQQEVPGARSALECALPLLKQQGPDLGNDSAVGVVTLPSKPAEEVDQHTHNHGRHYPFQDEWQHKAVDFL